MTPPVEGRCVSRFAPLREAFAASFAPQTPAADRELGAAICIVLEGRTVVDLWGGWADVARTRPWKGDTRGLAMSATKAWTALVTHRLVEEGRLDLDEPLAKVWPEFAAHGKGAITLAQVLDHTAGLPVLRPDVRNLRFEPKTWEARLAGATPMHAPGERRIYHALTQGYLLNAAIRRATGEDAGQAFQRLFAGPLGLAARMGADPAEAGDLCEIAPPLVPPGPPSTLAVEAVLQGMDPPDFNAPDFLEGLVPAANGIASARDLARLYAALLDPALSPLSAPTLARATALRWEGVEEMGGQVWRMALGLMLSSPFTSYGSSPVAFGHPGRGGANGFADPSRGLAVGYLCNAPDPRPGGGGRLPRLLQTAGLA